MVLPPLYQRWMDELLPGGIAPETRSTCSACAMVDRGGEDAPDTTFNEAVKCCTYHPELPNFLVGRILADERPGAETARGLLEERIAGRLGTSPYGLAAPPTFNVVYHHSSAFGRSATMLCPFYLSDGGLCGIYPHREGVCATFFCRYVRGASGRAFWNMMNQLLKSIDVGLRLWCVDQIDGGGATTTGSWMMHAARGRPLDESSLVGTVSPGEYRWMWAGWEGREAEFYRRCAELVEPLGLNEVLDICGSPTRATSRMVSLVHGSARDLPARVTRGTTGLVQIGRRAGRMRVRSSAAPLDHVDVPAEVVAAVPRLLEGPLAEAVAAVRAEGVPLDDETLRWLIDFEVIVPAPQ